MGIVRLMTGLLVGLALIPSAALAKKVAAPSLEAYHCKMTSGEENAIPGEIIIIRDKVTNEYKVIDGKIQHLLKDPIKAEVRNESAKRLDLAWTVRNVPSRNAGHTDQNFTLTFMKDTHQYFESVVVRGFDNNEHTSGTCTLMK